MEIPEVKEMPDRRLGGKRRAAKKREEDADERFHGGVVPESVAGAKRLMRLSA
jgi:hypothetical protein